MQGFSDLWKISNETPVVISKAKKLLDLISRSRLWPVSHFVDFAWVSRDTLPKHNIFWGRVLLSSGMSIFSVSVSIQPDEGVQRHSANSEGGLQKIIPPLQHHQGKPNKKTTGDLLRQGPLAVEMWPVHYRGQRVASWPQRVHPGCRKPSLSPSSNLTCQYPLTMSSVVNHLAPVSVSSVSSIRGRGYASCRVKLHSLYDSLCRISHSHPSWGPAQLVIPIGYLTIGWFSYSTYP